MPVQIGVIVDLSGSMEKSIGDTDRMMKNKKMGSWAKSIFKVIDNVVKNDLHADNKVFVIGTGANKEPKIFDLLHTVYRYSLATNCIGQLYRSKEEMICKIYEILERRGAKKIRDWATEDRIDREVMLQQAKLLLTLMYYEPSFTEKIIDILPQECFGMTFKGKTAQVVHYIPFVGLAADIMVDSNIDQVVNKAVDLAYNVSWIFFAVPYQSVLGVHEARAILHGCEIDKNISNDRAKELIEQVKPFIYGRTPLNKALQDACDEAQNILHDREKSVILSDDRAEELIEQVKPFIYGLTPLYKALQDAYRVFQHNNLTAYKRLLLVVSDGYPTDSGVLHSFSDAKIHVACCFISDCSKVRPRCLYSKEGADWEDGAKFMFQQSTAVETKFIIPHAFLTKHKWEIEVINNKTNLFFFVNHPDLIDEAYNFAERVVTTKEALSDVLTSASHDAYINQWNRDQVAKEQVGGTCYANASAVVLHLAMKRIIGREGGYPDFFKLRDEMIAEYGDKGAKIPDVMHTMCDKYRLQYKFTDMDGAKQAITFKRPVLACFLLTPKEWDQFSNYFESNKTGTLSVENLDISKRCSDETPEGHAVVLMNFNEDHLLLMNSWGTDWGDDGFFRVQNDKVLGLYFVDVFWTLQDLTQNEKAAYKGDGQLVATLLMHSLKGLQTYEYRCPLCKKTANVSQFSGTVRAIRCPSCRKIFDPSDYDAHDLALNIHLTSLNQ